MSSKFYIVDVFSQKKFSGNQLAVFTNGSEFSGTRMQLIAKEINFSETTFIFPENSRENIFNVRIFTPSEELPFAGHPTLGTAFVIQKYLLNRKYHKIILDLKVGLIPVDIEYQKSEIELLTMKQKEPSFGSTFNPESISKIFKNIDIDTNYPIEEVSTGVPFIIVPVNSLKSIKNIQTDVTEYMKFIKGTEAKCFLTFTPETYKKENQLNARVFANYFGVPEDPATGSANGCLLGYLLKHNYFDSKNIEIKVEQGFEIGRDAIIYLKGEKSDNRYDIYVGGKVHPIAECNLL